MRCFPIMFRASIPCLNLAGHSLSCSSWWCQCALPWERKSSFSGCLGSDDRLHILCRLSMTPWLTLNTQTLQRGETIFTWMLCTTWLPPLFYALECSRASCTLLSTLSHTCKYILSTSYSTLAIYHFVFSNLIDGLYGSIAVHSGTGRLAEGTILYYRAASCLAALSDWPSPTWFSSHGHWTIWPPPATAKKKLRKHIQLHIGAYPFFAVFVMMCITFTGYWASGDVTFGRPRSSVLTLRSLSSTLVQNSCLFSWAVRTQTKCNQAVLTLVQHCWTENYTVLI